MTTPPSFPPPDSEDDDDTRWALTTAAALWKSGRYRDALPWLERAASAAARARASRNEDPGSSLRVVQLTMAAAELAAFVEAWAAGKSSAEPSSIPISVAVDTEAIDVLSLPSADIETVVEPLRAARVDVPRIPRPDPPPAPKRSDAPPLPPRPQLFAGTLQQAERPPLPELPPSTVPVYVPRVPPRRPEVVIRSGRRVLATTLPEAVPSPLAPESPLRFDAPATPATPAASPAAPGAHDWSPTDSVPTRRMEDVPTRRMDEKGRRGEGS